MTEAESTKDPEKVAVGERLRKLRSAYGWTLGNLAERTQQIDPSGAGVSKVSISRYENGDSLPGYREIKLLSQALAVTVSTIFYGDDLDPYTPYDRTLDEYLRDIVRDILIDHKLIPGTSSKQRQLRKASVQQDIEDSRRPLSEGSEDS